MPLLLLLPVQLTAQAVGTITGTVTATDGAPLGLARIVLVGTNDVTLTRDDGRFSMAGVSAGSQIIQVKKIGYEAVLLPIEVHAGETVNVSVSLTVLPVPLSPVKVEADRELTPAMRGFEERRARGSGHFFNRVEIARMQPRVFTDVLRRVPGVQIQPMPGPFGTGELVRMARTIGVMGARSCPVLFYMNGAPFPVTGDIPINFYIDPDEVIALEIYNGMSQIPPQFNSNLLNARCGVIVIWTRTAVDSTQSR
ncbi:MAG TPA: carboxypeptidase regulatory-like domain-containing protein [Gemmatimonadales bacterium]|nr:carboxypeptidase regulatory-like domain-containing protein [Gemmatimonadales bacterium]